MSWTTPRRDGGAQLWLHMAREAVYNLETTLSCQTKHGIPAPFRDIPHWRPECTQGAIDMFKGLIAKLRNTSEEFQDRGTHRGSAALPRGCRATTGIGTGRF